MPKTTDDLTKLTSEQLAERVTRELRKLGAPDASGRAAAGSAGPELQALLEECRRRGVEPLALF